MANVAYNTTSKLLSVMSVEELNNAWENIWNLESTDKEEAELLSQLLLDICEEIKKRK